MEYKLKDYEYYEKLKEETEHICFNEWKSISYEYFVGNCSYLYHKYCPVDYADFFEKYINDYDDSFSYSSLKGNPLKGRSLEQIKCLADHMCKNVNKSFITSEICFDLIIYHVIHQTFDGHIVENELMMSAVSTGKYKAEGTIGFIDIKCGVDIILTSLENPKKHNFIQVKPISFIRGNCKYNGGLLSDRLSAFVKEDTFRTELYKNGRSNEFSPIEYVFYNKEKLNKEGVIELLTINGKKRFRLDEVLNRDGTTKLKKNEEYFEVFKRKV